MHEYVNTKQQHQKNEDAPREGGRSSSNKGKGPANGRSYVKKTWPQEDTEEKENIQKEQK